MKAKKDDVRDFSTTPIAVPVSQLLGKEEKRTALEITKDRSLAEVVEIADYLHDCGTEKVIAGDLEDAQRASRLEVALKNFLWRLRRKFHRK